MNKTLYLKDEDGPLWERARELSGDKISPVIVDALRKFVAEKEASASNFERIVITFPDADNLNIPTAKAFYGRWIYGPDDPICADVDVFENNFVDRFAIAETAKGNVVAYSYRVGNGEDWGHRLSVFPSFEKAAADEKVNYAIRKALERRGVPVQELDI